MDREKVIKEKLDEMVELTRGLSYASFMTAVENATDILALLKEQEHKDRMFHALEDDWKRLKELLKEHDAVEPKQVDLYGNDEWWGLVCVCPDCNAEWMTDKANTHFCPNCGRSVKWE